MEGLKNLRAFEVTYLPPTNNKGARLAINDLRHKKRKIISFDYEQNDISLMADAYLKSKGIINLYRCETKKGYILLTENFELQIK